MKYKKTPKQLSHNNEENTDNYLADHWGERNVLNVKVMGKSQSKGIDKARVWLHNI